jgi:hypothetical protein
MTSPQRPLSTTSAPKVAESGQAHSPATQHLGKLIWNDLLGRPTNPANLMLGLPLADTTCPVRLSAFHYAITTVDGSGRLAEINITRHLSWSPGQRIKYLPVDGLVIAVTAANGTSKVTGRGYLRLPATIRHYLRAQSGDRLFLAACPDLGKGFLVIYPMAAVDALLHFYHSRPGRGEP